MHDPKHIEYVRITNAIYEACHRICTDRLMSWDDKIATLQYIYKKIPALNRLAIELKTREINSGK